MNYNRFFLSAMIFTVILLSTSLENALAQNTGEVAIPSSAAGTIEYIQKEDFSFLNGKTGTVIFDRWEENNLKELTNVSCKCKVEKFVNCDSLNDSLAMLKTGKADFMLTTDITASYVAHRNPDLKAVIFDISRAFTAEELKAANAVAPVEPGDLAIVMTLRKSDAALRDSINAAIKKIKENGTMAELENKWIKEMPAGSEPAGVAIDKIEKAETVYIGVSGDMPPLDYIAADGKPAGYNVALLAEISKLTGKNIEVISLDSKARFAALVSKKIDVFFWIVIPNDKFVQNQLKENPDEKKFNEKFTITEPHCVVKTAFIMKK